MPETRADNCADIEMTDTAFISPSSSPGQPSGVVLPVPSSPTSHPSPPLTPSGSPRQESSCLVRCDEVGKLHLHLHQELHGCQTNNKCGSQHCRIFSSASEQLQSVVSKSDRVSEAGDDVSESEEMIDVIGDDTDSVTMTSDSDVRKDVDSSDVSIGLDDSKGHGGDGDGDDDDEDNNYHGREESPPVVTNFSIAAILKPDFGSARKVQLGRYSPSQLLNNTFHNALKPGFNLHARFLNLHHHNHSQHPRHHHHHHQQQQQIQAHGLLQQRHSPTSPTSPSPVDLSTRGRSAPRPDSHTDKVPVVTSMLDFTKTIHSGSNTTAGKTTTGTTDNNGGGNSVKQKKATTANGNKNRKNSDNDITVDNKHLWPAWVFCTRYSDRPSSGPRSRRMKRKEQPTVTEPEKRPRTAFTSEQLSRLRREFDDCRYLTESRRRHLAAELGLTESQIKIWFQNKRAKLKKASGVKNELAMQLMAQGLYNHSTVPVEEDSDARRTDSGDDVIIC